MTVAQTAREARSGGTRRDRPSRPSVPAFIRLLQRSDTSRFTDERGIFTHDRVRSHPLQNHRFSIPKSAVLLLVAKVYVTFRDSVFRRGNFRRVTSATGTSHSERGCCRSMVNSGTYSRGTCRSIRRRTDRRGCSTQIRATARWIIKSSTCSGRRSSISSTPRLSSISR